MLATSSQARRPCAQTRKCCVRNFPRPTRLLPSSLSLLPRLVVDQERQFPAKAEPLLAGERSRSHKSGGEQEVAVCTQSWLLCCSQPPTSCAPSPLGNCWCLAILRRFYLRRQPPYPPGCSCSYGCAAVVFLCPPLSGVAVDRSTGAQGGELMSAAARQERLLELYAQDQVLQRRVATRHGWRQRHAATVPAGILVVVVGQSRGQREFEFFTSNIQR